MCRLSHNRTQEFHPAHVERLHPTTPKHGNALRRAMPQTRVLYKPECCQAKWSYDMIPGSGIEMVDGQ
jgi:hypothetical protein